MVSAGVAATMLTRFIPFIAFRPGKPTPKYILYLGKVLPASVFALLVVYCLRHIHSFSADSLAQVAGVAFTILIHVWKRNMMWSIAAGTLCYMLLNSQFYTFFQPIFSPLLTLFQLFDDIINQNSLSARVCRKAQHFIGTLQYF
jgi:branched-subunit amino acid transport protein AzlD